jgi:hypothetical protein
MKTAEEQYPEYAKEAAEIAYTALRKINNSAIDLYRERKIEAPYPAQLLLEMTIKKLEQYV